MSGVLRDYVIGATEESFPLFRCPGCEKSGEIDRDQFEGRVSIVCTRDGCTYHETKNWKAVDEGTEE